MSGVARTAGTIVGVAAVALTTLATAGVGGGAILAAAKWASAPSPIGSLRIRGPKR